MTHKLDNPIWYALSETHQQFAIDYGTIKFYHPDYCPFGGFYGTEDHAAGIDAYSSLNNNFFVVGEKPTVSDNVTLNSELVCLQMIIENKIDLDITGTIRELGEENREELYQLVNLVQPGYFKRKTPLLGNYFGIFKDDTLIAVTGERIKMSEYTEVSAVVTHPDHTGRGYAKALVTHTVNRIIDEGKMPCLHVAAHNTGAIKLYDKLGFTTRRKISLWNITPNA